jgi:hypothetical protein
MFQVEIYGRVRRAVRVEGQSQRVVGRRSSIREQIIPDLSALRMPRLKRASDFPVKSWRFPSFWVSQQVGLVGQ